MTPRSLVWLCASTLLLWHGCGSGGGTPDGGPTDTVVVPDIVMTPDTVGPLPDMPGLDETPVPDGGPDGPPPVDMIVECPKNPQPTGFQLTPFADNLVGPVAIVSPPGDTERVFIVEQVGTIQLYRNGQRADEPFLDISALPGQVGGFSAGGEQGLLSLAFHPKFAQNGRFYVYYTRGDGDVVLAEYTVDSANPDRAEPNSRVELLRQEHSEFGNHNGGTVAFGPDGYLYLSIGDGGDRADPYQAAQDLSFLLGKLLRIDVDGAGQGKAYAIPPDNPFVKQATARPEIWAYGLRNPWRFSFDPKTGDLYIGDVGQDAYEEISVVSGHPAGVNYGWSIMEGDRCFPDDGNCPTEGLTLPVLTQPQQQGRCSITGGHVYRGCTVPELQGRYVFGDYCSAQIFSFVYSGGQATDLQEHTDALGGVIPNAVVGGGISTFGVDGRGELYVADYGGGIVYRFAPK